MLSCQLAAPPLCRRLSPAAATCVGAEGVQEGPGVEDRGLIRRPRAAGGTVGRTRGCSGCRRDRRAVAAPPPALACTPPAGGWLFSGSYTHAHACTHPTTRPPSLHNLAARRPALLRRCLVFFITLIHTPHTDVCMPGRCEQPHPPLHTTNHTHIPTHARTRTHAHHTRPHPRRNSHTHTHHTPHHKLLLPHPRPTHTAPPRSGSDTPPPPPRYLPQASNLLHWAGMIKGPVGTPYEGGIFKVDIQLPSDYPFVPPKVERYRRGGGRRLPVRASKGREIPEGG
eukprot:scaffold402_cov96-Isochrysis_galbana.AAC.3